MKCLAHELRDPCRVVDLHHPLAQRLQEPPVLDFLECLSIGMSALDLADEHHHRSRILRGVVETDRRVAGTRPARDDDDARPSGELAVGFRHVRGTAFVPAGDRRDRVARVVEGVESGEIALAGHAEHGVDAVDSQRVDQDLAAGAPAVSRHVRHPACAHRRGANSRIVRAVQAAPNGAGLRLDPWRWQHVVRVPLRRRPIEVVS